ncbi:galactokinase [Mergibacter septicus]|uniref:Galactokinase n=1 Tax=Mergibacter septicus TaxID=221402 RepID=A0A8D4LJH1_9PAST|nr:galactokinase [Mergibacter septicus]AWX15550.1 galactokinase [Mergibacter septicus]QDJ14804.1 galactokinase [Mergibacter septicus]UTU47767.1 galactokinase [Mergibacter septicus]WMR96625.1 galactokinase [Mergibacter septicus]
MNPKILSPQIFAQQFSVAPNLQVYAPGRVNIIGEHTDYNDGFVMPCAINYGTSISGRKRDDHLFRVYAADLDDYDQFYLNQPITKSEKKWQNYLRGVVHFIQQQYPTFIQGADLVICGNVPLSAGLSSSASLEIAVGNFCQLLANLSLTPTELALIGQKAENQFVGCQCGNMDQLISALGQENHLLMIDCRNLTTKAVPFPPNLAIMVINSNVKHDLVTGEYNSRRQQCEMAAKFFNVPALRDVSLDQFLAQEKALMAIDPLVAKRAKHVISENQRVIDAVNALQQNDIKYLGELMAQSHQSMRDAFEITVPQIDYLVELAQTAIGQLGGARMTGGGFGGCVVAIAPVEKVEAVRKIIAENYQQKTGLKEDFYLCSAMAGVHQC